MKARNRRHFSLFIVKKPLACHSIVFATHENRRVFRTNSLVDLIYSLFLVDRSDAKKEKITAMWSGRFFTRRPTDEKAEFSGRADIHTVIRCRKGRVSAPQASWTQSARQQDNTTSSG